MDFTKITTLNYLPKETKTHLYNYFLMLKENTENYKEYIERSTENLNKDIGFNPVSPILLGINYNLSYLDFILENLK